VDNLEDLQILYGIDTIGGDKSADQYVAAPGNWGQVVSARVCVQARSPNNVNNAPQRFLNCGGALGTATGGAAFTTAGAGDLRLRRTFIATINLRNRVP
jgi:type IV pilus assembly protein PilW